MTQPARWLVEHLRAELHEPGLGYAELLTPITGGYDTRIFAFRLSGAPEPFSIPLILRVLGSQHPPARVLSERTAQNTVAGLGYRSEERRVGKECRSRWWTCHEKKKFIQVRHEESAAFMACAYAKYTGKLGVCFATSCPGGLDLLHALYDAKLDL